MHHKTDKTASNHINESSPFFALVHCPCLSLCHQFLVIHHLINKLACHFDYIYWSWNLKLMREAYRSPDKFYPIGFFYHTLSELTWLQVQWKWFVEIFYTSIFLIIILFFKCKYFSCNLKHVRKACRAPNKFCPIGLRAMTMLCLNWLSVYRYRFS